MDVPGRGWTAAAIFTVAGVVTAMAIGVRGVGDGAGLGALGAALSVFGLTVIALHGALSLTARTLPRLARERRAGYRLVLGRPDRPADHDDLVRAAAWGIDGPRRNGGLSEWLAWERPAPAVERVVPRGRAARRSARRLAT